MTQTSSENFTLHPVLAADSLPVARLTLCEVLLINDARYVWCVLVPRLPGLSELHDVPSEHQATLYEEIDRVSKVLKSMTFAHKMNVAALGNIVEQLHVHVIARQKDDPAWPGPVWGVGAAEPYSPKSADALIRTLRSGLGK